MSCQPDKDLSDGQAGKDASVGIEGELGKVEEGKEIENDDAVSDVSDDEEMMELLAQGTTQTQTQVSTLGEELSQDNSENQESHDSVSETENQPDAGNVLPENVQLPKRARSAYFIFANDKRPEIMEANQGKAVGEIAKLIAEKWKGLELTEREKFEAMARKEKEAYQAEIRRLESLGVDVKQLRKKNSGQAGPGNLPLAKIRTMMRRDPEIKNVSKDAAIVVTKATEMFIEYLGKSALDLSGGKKKTINKLSVHRCIHEGPEQLEFLTHDFDKPSVIEALEKLKKNDAEKKALPELSRNPITNFFKPN